jgi:hypothetical protein
MTDKASANLRTALTRNRKNITAAFFLALFLGPVGLLYASIWGGLLLILAALMLLPLTTGMAAFAIWPLSVLWALVATVGGGAPGARRD